MFSSIEAFCVRHSACVDGRDWAVANCTDMADAWNKLPPAYLIWVAACPGVLNDYQLATLGYWIYKSFVEPFGVPEWVADVARRSAQFRNGEITATDFAACCFNAEQQVNCMAYGNAKAVAAQAMSCLKYPVRPHTIYDVYAETAARLHATAATGLDKVLPRRLHRRDDRSALRHAIASQVVDDCFRADLAAFIRSAFNNPFQSVEDQQTKGG